MKDLDSAIVYASAAPSPDASRLFADVYAELKYDDLDYAAVEAAVRGIVDTLGVSIAATTLSDEYPTVLAYAGAAGGTGDAALLGSADRVPLPMAAFAFGALTHMLDYDDIADAAVVHPSAAVVASVLTAADCWSGVSGKELLTAVAVGQDLNIRLGESLTKHAVSHGWLPSVVSVLGATAAVGKLLRLTATQIQHALSIAVHQAGGTRQAGVGEGSSVRAIRDGFNARNAVTSALLAQAGARGDESAFEGAWGLFKQFFDGDFDRNVLLDGIGVNLRGPVTGHKPWPSCRYSHLFIEPTLRLVRDQDLRPSDITAIVAVGQDDILEQQCQPRALRTAPGRAIDAKNSLPFQLGKIVTRRALRLDDFTAVGLADEAAIDVATRVSWRVEPSADKVGLGTGKIEMSLTDGTVIRSEASGLPGGPADPLPWPALLDKFRDCAAHAANPLGTIEADALVATIRLLPSRETTKGLLNQLAGGNTSTLRTPRPLGLDRPADR